MPEHKLIGETVFFHPRLPSDERAERNGSLDDCPKEKDGDFNTLSGALCRTTKEAPKEPVFLLRTKAEANSAT